ncbi:MAG: glycerol-3-phosphate dehydrogenase [Pseudomonadota bacterium]
MKQQHFDLCVIGGGINGAGVARDAAGRGLSVILLEAGDLGSMTSSASSKMLHGGLRYLEQFEFKLVREALKERQTIMRIAPHISKPMDFVLPHTPEQRSRFVIQMGLFLYDFLAGKQRLKSSRAVQLLSDPVGKPFKDHHKSGFCYTDGQVDDARLVVLNAVDAKARGAVIKTYTAATQIEEHEQGWEIAYEERLSGRLGSVTASTIVNAAGPASDQVHALVEQVTQPVPEGVKEDTQEQHEADAVPGLRLVKGSHIIVRKLYEGDQGYLLQSPDKRAVFVWPYEGQYTLIGTTEVEYEGHPGDAEISDEEIDYLCGVVNGFTKRSVQRADIVAQFSGVRPLVESEGKSARTASRRHMLHERKGANDARILTIYGGKLTTYRLIAQELMDHIVGARNDWTACEALPGGQFKQVNFDLFLQEKLYQYSTVERSYVRRLARQYGTRMDEILQNAKRLDDLGAHYGDDVYENEVVFLIREEFARTPRDILWRRTKLDLNASEETRKKLEAVMPDLLKEHLSQKGEAA